MQDNYTTSKKNLQLTLAQIVKEHRKNKSISKISAEIMMTKSMWTDLEKGIKDPQLSTLWRVAEALDMNLGDLIKEVREKLGDDFTLVD